MENSNNDTTYYAGYAEQLGSLGIKRLENSLILHKTEEGMALCLVETDILTFTEDGRVILRNGGWTTRFTIQKMNAYLPVGVEVSQKQGEWHLTLRGNEHRHVYREGMVLAIQDGTAAIVG